MDEKNLLAEQFEGSRRRLNSVAYRMLGSRAEAEDAVQEAWLRLSRSDVGDVGNLEGWLTTVVARLCLDMLRQRKTRREDQLETPTDEPTRPEPTAEGEGADPERDLAIADSVGLAMLVVLDTLSPAERVAFVLHDMFAVPFEDIGPIIDRSEAATRQLASRARRRVQGAPATETHDRERRAKVVSAFLAAARDNNFEALMELLDPGVVFRADAFAARMASDMAELRGAEAVAGAFRGKAQAARPALIDGEVGFAVVFGGKTRIVVYATIADGRIAALDAVADPRRIAAMEIDPIDR